MDNIILIETDESFNIQKKKWNTEGADRNNQKQQLRLSIKKKLQKLK